MFRRDVGRYLGRDLGENVEKYIRRYTVIQRTKKYI